MVVACGSSTDTSKHNPACSRESERSDLLFNVINLLFNVNSSHCPSLRSQGSCLSLKVPGEHIRPQLCGVWGCGLSGSPQHMSVGLSLGHLCS